MIDAPADTPPVLSSNEAATLAARASQLMGRSGPGGLPQSGWRRVRGLKPTSTIVPSLPRLRVAENHTR